MKYQAEALADSAEDKNVQKRLQSRIRSVSKAPIIELVISGLITRALHAEGECCNSGRGYSICEFHPKSSSTKSSTEASKSSTKVLPLSSLSRKRRRVGEEEIVLEDWGYMLEQSCMDNVWQTGWIVSKTRLHLGNSWLAGFSLALLLTCVNKPQWPSSDLHFRINAI